ncbi:MAG: hypothetical protein LBU21_10550, partial [Treponema sp.]|nr:hypothetical protein [Treponema sp.]
GVNLRTSDGATAASIAYENGLVDIYGYLVEQGAVEFVQSPAQAENSSGSGQSTGQSSGLGISNLIEGGTLVLRTGTYRLSGSSAEITLSGSGTQGYLSYKNNAGNTATGVFWLTGNTLLLTTEGLTFSYQVDTTDSFSGNGETWVRVGN